MNDINKEFRFYTENMQQEGIDQNGVYVVKSKPTLTIDNDGNIAIKDSDTYCLSNKDDIANPYAREYTNDYFGIMHITNDCYVVLGTDIKVASDISQNPIEENKFKFGIIELQRNYSKEIIKKSEEIIAPITYDRIYVYDPLYPILEKDGHYTYFCLDPESKNYKKQLVPLVLESAAPFNIKYPGFAECTIDGKTRFLPIDFIAVEAVTPDDLLTEEEILNLINCHQTFKKLQRTAKKQIPSIINSLQK